jgi:hypothetical protein
MAGGGLGIRRDTDARDARADRPGVGETGVINNPILRMSDKQWD